jgi:hypothetical protein
LILHIPHSSCLIPPDLRDQITLSDKEILAELLVYQKECRVISIMIEINREPPMEELSGVKNESFEVIKKNMQIILNSFKEF